MTSMGTNKYNDNYSENYNASSNDFVTSTSNDFVTLTSISPDFWTGSREDGSILLPIGDSKSVREREVQAYAVKAIRKLLVANEKNEERRARKQSQKQSQRDRMTCGDLTVVSSQMAGLRAS